MMKREFLVPILIGIALALFVLAIFAGNALFSLSGKGMNQKRPTAIFTIIHLPTSVITVDAGTVEDQNMNSGGKNVGNSSLEIGSYIQIVGTGGVGLRMREEPGKNGKPKFIAMENEIFSIKGGPIYMDDINWWLLVAPYDDRRQGWAAGQYLKSITKP